MRGDDRQESEMFLYGSLEERVPEKHPLRPGRAMVDAALESMSGRFDEMYAKAGRPSIAPERLLRALLLQALYSIRSERMLVEQLDYNLLFRWFVGLNFAFRPSGTSRRFTRPTGSVGKNSDSPRISIHLS